MIPQAISPGEDSRTTWRQVNALIDEIRQVRQELYTATATIGLLRNGRRWSGGQVVEFKIVEVWMDVLKCVRMIQTGGDWDWDITDNAVFVAKPTLFRAYTALTRTIDTVTIDYVYDTTDGQHRVATGSDTTEQEEIIVDRYLADDVIIAAPVERNLILEDGTVELVAGEGYVDLNSDGRNWAKIEAAA